MRILALDAATSACSVALVEDGRVLAHRLKVMERGQAEALMPMLADALDETGLAVADFDRIAATVGPGAFTGIRIGLAAARGLCLASGKPFFGLTTTRAVAGGVFADERPGMTLVTVVEAKRAELFGQLFSPDLEPLGEIFAAAPQDFVAHLPNTPLMLVGDGSIRLKDVLRGPNVSWSRAPGHPDAVQVALGVAERADQGHAPLPPRPLYLRAPDVTLPK
ncbi:MAG: tRNA (adenosine(37)-N6)-threonylcarbamoyltransferase complex dimerization subunit type 1 TsaB [Rhodospirillales bacterium]|nr:tRNA (adenosine(37)-N6)-threonylcarbamoyltransferase complex dimerization subunit type 1 TsaB [Rhodospirillales bacterium]